MENTEKKLKKVTPIFYLLKMGIPFFALKVSEIFNTYGAGKTSADFTISVLKSSLPEENAYIDPERPKAKINKPLGPLNLGLSEDETNINLLVHNLTPKEQEFILDNLGTKFLERKLSATDSIFEVTFAAHYIEALTEGQRKRV